MGLIAAGAGAALMIGGAAMSAGKKVKVPTFQRVNTEKEQEAAIKQNIASLQSGTELATKTTAAEQNLLEQQLRRAIPGYDQLISQASQNIGAGLRGELSPEASRNVQRYSAAQAISRGYRGGSEAGLFGAVKNYAGAIGSKAESSSCSGAELHPAAAYDGNGATVLGEQHVHYSDSADKSVAARESVPVPARHGSCSSCGST